MNRFNHFETDASKALFLSTYRCPNNEGNGFKVLLLVDSVKSAKDEIIARITGVEDLTNPSMVDLANKQWDAWDDKETLLKNLRIVELPLEKRADGIVKKLITKLERDGFTPDFVIGSNDEDLNKQLEEFIEPFREVMTDFDDFEEFAMSDSAAAAQMLLDEYKKNKKV